MEILLVNRAFRPGSILTITHTFTIILLQCRSFVRTVLLVYIILIVLNIFPGKKREVLPRSIC